MALVVVGLGWVIGLLPVGVWDAPWWMGGAWVCAAAPATLALGPLKHRHRLYAAALVAAGLSGWLLNHSAATSPAAWATLAGEDVTVRGIVDSEPQRGLTSTGYVLKITSLTSEDGAVHRGGKLLVYFNQYDRYLPGDRVVISGELASPATELGAGYRAYLERRGISGTVFRPAVLQVESGKLTPRRWLTEQRLAFDRALQRALPEPESSLAAGIAFGRDDGLSQDTASDFNRSGLRHLVAVSGSNVTLVAGFGYLLFIPLIGRRWAWIPAGAAILAYLGASGLAPSVIRAGVMAMVFLVGAALGRPQSGLPGLAAAVIVMTALSPAIARDPGFIMSATATAGILAFYLPIATGVRAITRKAGPLTPPEWVCQSAALTVSATVATTPVTWVVFGRVSLISPIANVVVPPVFTVAFWCSLLLAVASRISNDAGWMFGLVGYYPLAFIAWCAGSFASLPGAAINVPGRDTSLAVAAYAALVPLALLAYRFPVSGAEEPAPISQRRAASSRFVFGAAAGAAAVVILPGFGWPHGDSDELTVRFFDVGQGDAALIVTPNGRQVLIDGGPSGLGLARSLSDAMPHWDRSIDLVILSHPQEDHMAGLPEVASRYSVVAVRDAGFTNGTATYRYFDQALPGRTTTLAGERFTLDGVDFEILWSGGGVDDSELNNTSLVIRVSYRNTSFLFTGDSEAPVHQALIRGSVDLSADVLKVPHHGSKTTDPALFAAVHPGLAVISVGANNIFGHPHPDTMAALEMIPTLRTDEHGTVTVRTDGEQLRVSTGR